jgi:hypothetical protein
MNFLKYLFTVPKGEKITDRALKRVLISSVCGILLCMTGLVTTTWAWYTASVETAPFSIQVAEHHVQLTGESNQELKNPVALESGMTVKLTAEFVTDAQPDERNLTPGRYIRLEVKFADSEDRVKIYVQTEKDDNGRWLAELELTSDKDCTVSFYSQWQVPMDAEVLKPGVIKLSAATTTGETEEEEQAEENTAEDEKSEGQKTPVKDEESEQQTPNEGEKSEEQKIPVEGEQTGEEADSAEPETTTAKTETVTP